MRTNPVGSRYCPAGGRDRGEARGSECCPSALEELIRARVADGAPGSRYYPAREWMEEKPRAAITTPEQQKQREVRTAAPVDAEAQ
jgi:hypothetical protein